MTPRTYASPEAFKQALEQRLRAASGSGPDLARPRPNSRVKDLPDIALLASIGALEASRLAEALEQTFTFRKTHALPALLPRPNAAWEMPYAAMAKADQLAWSTLADVTAAAKAFLDPSLAGERDARWGADVVALGSIASPRLHIHVRLAFRSSPNRHCQSAGCVWN
jgi:hypothetical protein